VVFGWVIGIYSGVLNHGRNGPRLIRERPSAFEVWVWRRMEKIIWLDRVSCEQVLQKVQGNMEYHDS